MKNIPAKLWKRVLAYIIDSFIISFIIIGPFSSKLQSSIQADSISELISTIQSTFTAEFFLISIVMAILTLIYWGFLEWKFNQSIGKMILNIKIISTTKKPVTLGQAIIRNVTKLSTIILIIDCLRILKDKKKLQRFFEIISKTQVLEGATK